MFCNCDNFIVIIKLCSRTHWAQKYSIYLSNKNKTMKKYLFMFYNTKIRSLFVMIYVLQHIFNRYLNFIDLGQKK